MRRLLRSQIATVKFSSSSTPNMLKIGDILKQVRVFSDSDIAEYSKLTHDFNPLHFDSECAKLAGFIDRPVPGMLVASLFPCIIASHFPGAVYVKQTLEFKLPIYKGEEITGEVQASIIRQVKEKYIAKFYTKCYKNASVVTIDGEATAILPTLSLNTL